MKSGRYRVASGAQCVAVEIPVEKLTLYSPLHPPIIAPRHCRGSTASTALHLYSSTPSTLYNPLQHPSDMRTLSYLSFEIARMSRVTRVSVSALRAASHAASAALTVHTQMADHTTR